MADRDPDLDDPIAGDPVSTSMYGLGVDVDSDAFIGRDEDGDPYAAAAPPDQPPVWSPPPYVTPSGTTSGTSGTVAVVRLRDVMSLITIVVAFLLIVGGSMTAVHGAGASTTVTLGVGAMVFGVCLGIFGLLMAVSR